MLDNSTQVLDAVLTKKGRELLSKGERSFKITKFAISDEGVDYRSWNPSHPSGSAYYADQITSMPLLEATVDETMSMKYKLVTLPKGTAKMPMVSVTPTVLALDYGETANVTPNTRNAFAGFNNQTYGYTCILSNADVATLQTGAPAPNQKSLGTVPSWLDDTSLRKSATAVGMNFKVIARDVTALSESDRSATITVIGNETGGQADLTITVAPPTGSSVTDIRVGTPTLGTI